MRARPVKRSDTFTWRPQPTSSARSSKFFSVIHSFIAGRWILGRLASQTAKPPVLDRKITALFAAGTKPGYEIPETGGLRHEIQTTELSVKRQPSTSCSGLTGARVPPPPSSSFALHRASQHAPPCDPSRQSVNTPAIRARFSPAGPMELTTAESCVTLSAESPFRKYLCPRQKWRPGVRPCHRR